MEEGSEQGRGSLLGFTCVQLGGAAGGWDPSTPDSSLKFPPSLWSTLWWSGRDGGTFEWMRGRVFGGEEYSEGTTKAHGAWRSDTRLDFGVFFFRRKWGVPGKVFQERKDVAGGSGRLGCGMTD